MVPALSTRSVRIWKEEEYGENCFWVLNAQIEYAKNEELYRMVWSGNGHRQHPFSYPHFLLLDYSKLHVSFIFIVLEYNKDNIYIYIKFYYHAHIHSSVLVLCSNYMKILCIFYYFAMMRFHEFCIIILAYVQFFFRFSFWDFVT